MIMRRLSHGLLAIALARMTACASVAPTPPPPPTNTPLPTATFTPIPPTNTPVPPTDTPAPTNTPTKVPTKAIITTPRPTVQPVPISSAQVSSQPSTVEKSAKQGIDTTLAMIGLLDQMTNGKGAELCASLREKYQSIHTAPTYDVNGQTQQVQQAYALYRQAIDLIDSRSAVFLGCGQGHDAIGAIDLGNTHRTLEQASRLFGQALDWLRRGVSTSSGTPLANAIIRARNAAEDIGGVLDRRLGAVRAFPWHSNEPECAQMLDDYNIVINSPSFDVSAQPANVQAAYQTYRQAIDQFKDKEEAICSKCSMEHGDLTPTTARVIRAALTDIGGLLTDALNMLGQ